MCRASRSHRIQTLLLLVGWLIATGAHWDLVQVGAWGRMWVKIAQVQPPGMALATLFSPDAMCGICKTVQLARSDRAEHPMPGLNSAGKAPLILPAPRAIVFESPVAHSFMRQVNSAVPDSLRAAPPVPPPRLVRLASHPNIPQLPVYPDTPGAPRRAGLGQG